MENIRKAMLLVVILGLLPMAYGQSNTGAVYTMSNNATGNTVTSFDRLVDGTLSLSGTFSTHGLGTGSGLGNQGALMLDENGSMLLVVDAGSNEISAFKVKPHSLEFTDKVSSGGIIPISITIHENLVYVLNAGGAGNIAGFHLTDNGKLLPISGSSRPLSGGATAPAEISFNPDGNMLVVTEKATNKIDTYIVKSDGLTTGPIIQPSNGQTPFGFAFDNKGIFIVSEATNSALSSYKIDINGNIKTISTSIPDFQLAACWVVVTNNGMFAYTTNAHSNTISSYNISPKGVLTLLQEVAAVGNGPIDMALSRNSRFLYNLNSGDHTITGFSVGPDGSLTKVTTVGGLANAVGIAAT